MEENNPLEPSAVSLPKNTVLNNKRGRPSSAKVVKFTPQPKSIISRLLSRERENCDNIEPKGLKNIHRKRSISKHSSETDVHVQIESDSIEEEPNSYESIQGNSFDVTSLEEDDRFKSGYLLDNKEQSNFQNTITLWNKNEEPRPIEIICYICSHRSTSLKEHRKHLSTHRNQPYTCNFPSCQYSSKLSCNLIKHKRIHTSEKPYLCDQCTFRSNFANSLKVHKRIHTSEKPYCCQHCSYRCNSSSNLKKHCRHKHQNMS